MSLTEDFLDTLEALAAGAAGALAPVRQCMRRHTADSLGIALAATAEPGLAARLIEGVGPPVAQGPGVPGCRERLPAAAAAFVHSVLAHALDFDGIHDLARLHPTSVCLPAVWAARGQGADDEDRLLDALALGNEALCRLGLAAKPVGDGPVSLWFTTQLFGTLAAALAAARVMGLDRDGQRNALGLAYMQSAGGKEPAFGTGSTARRIYPGFAAMSGVQAARLAAAGVSGPADPLGGAAGIYRTYLGESPDASMRECLLGRSHWHALDVDIKPWPTCRLSHPYIGAALRLRPADGRLPERLVLQVNASARRLCEPREGRARPATLPDATYSIPFVTALTWVHGEPTLRRLRPEVLHDPAVLALAARIELVGGAPDAPGHPVGVVTAWLDGQERSSPTVPPGPLDDATLRAKFDDALAQAGRRDAEALWQGIVVQPGRLLASLEAACAAG